MFDATQVKALLRHPFNARGRKIFRREARGLPLPESLAAPSVEDEGRARMAAIRHQIERERLRIEILENLMAAKARGER